MANKLVQAVYDLKDNVTAKLSAIADAWRSNKAASDQAAAGIERNNKRVSESYAQAAEGIGKLRSALVAITAFVGIDKIKDEIEAVIDTGERLDDLRKNFDQVFGSVEKGGAALEAVRAIAANAPQPFEDIAAAALKMRQVGLDPLDGSLQALVDNANALNQSQDQLIATIDALGKANIRGEVSLRSFVSLVDAGIPVFDLLGKAMGLSEERVRALAESGQLGKDAVHLLITELGKLRAGVAADELGDTDAQLQKLRDSAAEFYNTIAHSGALDFFRDELKNLNAEVAAAAQDGRLQSLAKSISDGVVGTAQAVKSATTFVIEYSGALVLLAKAYALVKVQSFLDGMAGIATGATKATGAVRALSTVITAIPAVRLVVLGGSAILLASDYLKKLGETIGDNLPMTEKWRQRTEELNAEILAGAERFRVAAEAMQQYGDTQLLSADAASRLGDAERAAQAGRYDGLQKLLQLQIRYYEQLRAADALNADGLKYLEDLKARLGAVKGGYDALEQGARMAADALANRLTPGAQALAGGLKGIGDSSKDASASITALIGDFDKLNVVEIGDIALALQSIGEQSQGAAENVRDGLAATLSKLSSEDLQRFQLSATAAFDAVGRSGDKTAVILDTTLRVAMERLKVDSSKTGVAFTESGKQIITSFQVVAENARATSQQITASFEAALKGVNTKQEAEALGDALEGAANRGAVSFKELSAATRDLDERVRTITANISPLASQFELLGIKSQAQLEAVRDNAKQAFDAIQDGARKGTAAQEDVVRAFKAYSDAAKAAAADSGADAKKRVDEQLALQASVLGLADALKSAGDAGKDAGDKTASAYADAKEKVDETGQAISEAGDAARDAGKGQESYRTALEGTAAAMSGIIAIGPAQAAAMKELNALLMQDANLTNVGLQDAKYLLETLGPLAGGAAQILEARISELQAAADRAADTASRMRDQARDMLDQIAELEGDQSSIEDRRHQTKLQDLFNEAQEAGTLNSQGYRDLVALENRLHALKVSNLQKQAAEKKKAGAESAAREKQQAEEAAAAAKKQRQEEEAAKREQQQPITTASPPATTGSSGPVLGTVMWDWGNGKTTPVRGTPETAADMKAIVREFQRQKSLQPGAR